MAERPQSIDLSKVKLSRNNFESGKFVGYHIVEKEPIAAYQDVTCRIPGKRNWIGTTAKVEIPVGATAIRLEQEYGPSQRTGFVHHVDLSDDTHFVFPSYAIRTNKLVAIRNKHLEQYAECFGSSNHRSFPIAPPKNGILITVDEEKFERRPHFGSVHGEIVYLDQKSTMF